MTIRLHSNRLIHDSPSLGKSPSRRPLRIGLVNNMPAAAFRATEHQFRALLNTASDGLPIHLSLYVLRGTPMDASLRDHAASRYACVDELWNETLDGLIITGTEPTAPALRDEPYWHSFTQLLNWARDNTLSTICSCLAAHAAVLYMDGIERRKNHAKHFGIYPCNRVSDDSLLRGIPPGLTMPHSRWNGVAEQDLSAHGYRVLTRTPDAEVDIFIKQENSLFVFFQGHPEYATDTLLREYRRDIGRFLRHQTKAYPNLPRGYFERADEKAFASIEENAAVLHRDEVLAGIAALMPTLKIQNTWQPAAVRIYSNWLEHLCMRRDGQVNPNPEASSVVCEQ